MNPITILSFGGGVNSMAILCLAKAGKVKVDAVIFADPKAGKLWIFS